MYKKAFSIRKLFKQNLVFWWINGVSLVWTLICQKLILYIAYIVKQNTLLMLSISKNKRFDVHQLSFRKTTLSTNLLTPHGGAVL